MIYTFIPYSITKNLGKEYNRFMSLLPNDDDFAALLDHDSMFTDYDWYRRLEDYVKIYPACGCFVGRANRLGCTWQRTFDEGSKEWHNNNIEFHRKHAEKLIKKHPKATDMSNVDPLYVMGGVLILIKKSLWKKAGGFKEGGILGVDNDMHWRLQKLKEKVYMMESIYLYHWYRGGKRGDKSHLI